MAKPIHGFRHLAQINEVGGRYLYEKVYCARGEMENRIKECQLDLFADRTSAATMRANQLRLWLASMAYVLLCAVRRIGLAHTQFAQATCGTIRLKLLKIGAQVRVSVRRIKVAMASAAPIIMSLPSPTPNSETQARSNTNQTAHSRPASRQRHQHGRDGPARPLAALCDTMSHPCIYTVERRRSNAQRSLV